MIKKLLNQGLTTLAGKKITPAKVKSKKKPGVKEAKDEFQKTSPHKKRGLHKGIFAVGTAISNFSSLLGTSGKTFVMYNAILGSAPGGLTAIMGIMGATQSIAAGASEARYGAINRSLFGGISGTLEMAGGIAIMASSIGFGPIPALVGLGCFVGRFGYQIAHQLRKSKRHGPKMTPKLKATPDS